MAERLGNVLYWIGVLTGLACLAGGTYAAIYGSPSVSTLTAILASAAVGFIPYAIGWTLRYILSGRKL